MRVLPILIILVLASCSQTKYFHGEDFVYGSLTSYKELKLNKDGTYNEYIITPINQDTIVFRDCISGDYFWNNDTLVLTTTFNKSTIDVDNEKNSKPVIYSKYVSVQDSLIRLTQGLQDSTQVIIVEEKLFKGKGKKLNKAIRD